MTNANQSFNGYVSSICPKAAYPLGKYLK